VLDLALADSLRDPTRTRVRTIPHGAPVVARPAGLDALICAIGLPDSRASQTTPSRKC
jgi:hypothetical protein